MKGYLEAYKSLNKEQALAVDTIEGPVMVIAGPGTGKTQVLTLRIAHILTSTDTPADGVLCLTFTNAGVKAMRERLLDLIGPTAMRVKIATFHAYGLELIEEYASVLGYSRAPQLLDDTATVALFDDVFFSKEWQYVRPRSNPAMFYFDLKNLIALLKRDAISPEAFALSVEKEIERVQNDPESISSRGETKGRLKKDAEKKIESLARSLEAAHFYAAYEMLKTERNKIDYSDVLALMVRIATESDEAAATIREQFLYVLIDEHQDSSGVQNAFLEAVWKDTERPNLFVVGDDRQLIYGFGGASLAYFEGFKNAFGTATLITLTKNYRSTQTILDSAEALLSSTLAEGKLIGSNAETHPLQLVECDYPRDEIIAAGIDIKTKIENGIDPDHVAILVPKNKQVKSAVTILKDLGLPVAAGTALHLFELADTQSLLNILRIVLTPQDAIALGHSLLDPLTTIDPLVAHAYLYTADTRKLSISDLLKSSDEAIKKWGTQLSVWINQAQTTDAYAMIQIIGDELLLKQSFDDEAIRRRVEIIRTLLHLAMSQIESGQKKTLDSFMAFIDRLIEYGEDIPLAVFSAQKGIKVLTLHGSKGLEFDSVWIAHMDERSLLSSKRGGFVLPEDVTVREEALEEVAKRQLYVAITRAKRFCTISYARHNNRGADQTLASVIEVLPQELFIRKSSAQTEEIVLQSNLRDYVGHKDEAKRDQATELAALVLEHYAERKVSVTMLNNFFECPWKWYFRNLLQLPEPLTESLHVGNVTHKAIEYILDKKGNDISSESITGYIVRCADIEARYDDALSKRIIHQVTPIITSWMKRYYPAIVAPYDDEQNLNYRDPDFAHLHITGKIDLVEEIITGEVRVTDWKTGGVKTNSDVDGDDEGGHMSPLLRQLTMYSYLIDGHSHGDKSVVESRLVFLEAKVGDKNAIQSRKIARHDIERLRADIRDYDRLLRSGEWINQPCLTRHYAADDECEYCALAKKFGVKK